MRRNGAKTVLLFLPAAGAFALLSIRSAEASAAARAGLENCLRSVVPALFPFLVMTNLLLRLELPPIILGPLGTAFEALFNIRKTALPAFLAGLVGGYPLGAEAAAECCRLERCSGEEAERLLIISNNCSPGFLFGLVSGKLSGGGERVLALLLLQWLISAFLGILLGAGHRPSKAASDTEDVFGNSFFSGFPAAVRSGTRSILIICAYVVFFSVFTAFLPDSALLKGVVELTGGILTLSSGPWAEIMAAFLLGFGGLSVACQVLSSLEGTGISARLYLPLRLLHGLLMAFGMFILKLGSVYYLLYAVLLLIIAVFVKIYGKGAKSGV